MTLSRDAILKIHRLKPFRSRRRLARLGCGGAGYRQYNNKSTENTRRSEQNMATAEWDGTKASHPAMRARVAEWPCASRGGKNGLAKKHKRPAPQNRWSRGVDWPIVAWVVVVHAGALAAPFFFTWKALARLGVSGLADRQHRRLHGLSPAIDARQFFDLSPDSPAVRLHRRLVGRGLGPDVGGQSSQAPYVQRQGGRSAFSPRRQVVEPHAVVHAGARCRASSRS